MKTLFIFFFVLLGSQQSFATSFGCHHHYFAKIHFDRIAWGKEVKAVYAHVGAFQERAFSRGGGTYWNNMQHIELVQRDNSFSAITEIKGTSAYESTYNKGAVIQYWVYFTDGTELITEPTLIMINQNVGSRSFDGYKASLELQRTLLKQVTTIKRTEADHLKYCWTS